MIHYREDHKWTGIYRHRTKARNRLNLYRADIYSEVERPVYIVLSNLLSESYGSDKVYESLLAFLNTMEQRFEEIENGD